jgi:hypothetical protein
MKWADGCPLALLVLWPALDARHSGQCRGGRGVARNVGALRLSSRDLERTRGVWTQTGHCSARRVHPFSSFSPMPVETLLLFD